MTVTNFLKLKVGDIIILDRLIYYIITEVHLDINGKIAFILYGRSGMLSQDSDRLKYFEKHYPSL
jgi:hypothetical protein